MTLNGTPLSDTARLKLLRDEEQPRHHHPSPDINTVEALLQHGMMKRILMLSPLQWRSMASHERRAMLDYATTRANALEEKIAFMSRNMLPDTELPECYRAVGSM